MVFAVEAAVRSCRSQIGAPLFRCKSPDFLILRTRLRSRERFALRARLIYDPL